MQKTLWRWFKKGALLGPITYFLWYILGQMNFSFTSIPFVNVQAELGNTIQYLVILISIALVYGWFMETVEKNIK